MSCASAPEMKAQWVRVADVLLVGPLMVYGATRMPQGPAALLLGVLGVSTVLYNARNYRIVASRPRCS